MNVSESCDSPDRRLSCCAGIVFWGLKNSFSVVVVSVAGVLGSWTGDETTPAGRGQAAERW